MKKISLAIFAAFVALLLAGPPAQTQDNSAKSNAQAAGQQSKSAAKNTGKATEKTTNKAADKVTGKVDINSASSEELQKLQGVDPSTADKIVAGRPYNSKRDLVTRNILSQQQYEAIKNKIVAHKSTAKM